jgi:hypothetical protein
MNVGLGFHVEMTLDEALNYIQTKEPELNKYFGIFSSHTLAEWRMD